ncbi:hypothetical protein GCM10009113_04970 [Marinobacter szutsaonensis]
MGENFRVSGNKQNIIKREGFFSNSQHWDPPFERAKFGNPVPRPERRDKAKSLIDLL